MIQLYPHNQSAYEQLRDVIYKERQAIYISGVGTGKSFVMMKLIAEEFPGKRVLYITPQQAINENLKTYDDYKIIAPQLTHINMQQFQTPEKALDLIRPYDFIIMDECHHLYSDLFGANILRAVYEADKHFLGLTATPLRNDGRDVRTEFPAVVHGISNFEAIRQGLMPQFTYRIGVPDESLADYRKRLQETAQSGIRILRDYNGCKEVIRDIAQRYPRKKYIVFSESIDALQRDMAVIRHAFPGVPLFELHTRIAGGRPVCRDILHTFNEAESGILMSVDMALEGIHLHGVEGIILLRNVQSIPLFEQMLGRVCSVGASVSPVVIDCSMRGPALLQKLLKMNETGRHGRQHHTGVSGNGQNHPRVRDIFHIALGSHEEWADIEAFEQAWTEAEPAGVYQERIGEVHMALNGMKMTIVAYRGSEDVDVQFEDGTIRKQLTYNSIKSGEVGLVGRRDRFEQLKQSRVGEVYTMRSGHQATIIAYRSAKDVDIRFDDGSIREHIQYKVVVNGIAAPIKRSEKRQSRIGEVYTMNNGHTATIIECVKANDCTIQFDNGDIRKHVQYDRIKKGIVALPRQSRVGESYSLKNGHTATIIAYRRCNDCDIQFENGLIKEHVQYGNLKDGIVSLQGAYDPNEVEPTDNQNDAETVTKGRMI